MNSSQGVRRNEGGFILFGVIMLLAVILVMAPAMVQWLQREGRWASKEQKNLSAYNLAETGLDRGQWMLKSSTASWGMASVGTAISGYNFDKTYADVAGGHYRIRFSSGPSDRQVTVYAEGRDPKTGEARAIRAIYKNSAVPGPLLSKGDIKLAKKFFVHWGPVMSQKTITMDAECANRPYPRKYARLTVETDPATGDIRDRDTDGLAGTNKGADWESNYPVVNLPRLDLETLRSSAAATGTLNCFGRFGGYDPAQGAAGPNHTLNYSDVPSAKTYAFAHQTWSLTTAGPVYNQAQIPCQTTYGCTALEKNCASLPSGGNRVVEGFGFDPRAFNGLVWYWDGPPNTPAETVKVYETGNRGTFIFAGDARLDGDDLDTLNPELKPGWGIGNIRVPRDAWKEYETIDTTATGEYPGDPGGVPGPIPPSWDYQPTPSSPRMNLKRLVGGTEQFWMSSDIGIAGLLYTGGDLTINWAPEIFGAIWVNGDIDLQSTDLAAVLYDDSLQLPVLDVMLTNLAWVEISPSSTTWVAP